MQKFVAFAASLVLAGCSPAAVLNAVSGSSDVVETRDLAYGPLPRHQYDLYMPVGDDGSTPLVVFIHGGSWKEGDKGIYRFLGTALGERGYAVAVPNYRLFPEVLFPDFVEDAALATAHLMEEGRPVVLMGHSAGAHIAGLLAWDGRYLAAQGQDACALSGVIGVSGPYEFLPPGPTIRDIFPEERLADSQPINFAEGPAVPTLLLHGIADETVHVEDTELMADALEAAGNPVEARLYDGVGHIEIIGAMSPLLTSRAPTLADVTDWLNAQRAAGWPGCGG
ncbi:alpha/beta hydrolase [Pontivivens insulae]|uniref:BD-FAE-like domain-containing protein n=1 Tax=Pontivivens insulae TaxID=1639689 RepID=A0A2R8ADT7_9RHOB|nr:alpha/beta hydrolase [Pontivivens insulae]RED14302.1 acetyl esterase/lipase [Pontivivens insulae]SPF30379.1 hypothetical protein POI8812_02715 [Pontivivens insulae]